VLWVRKGVSQCQPAVRTGGARASHSQMQPNSKVSDLEEKALSIYLLRVY
jgi:hypothetical protein